MNLITALSQLGSFDHGACDTVLRDAHVHIALVTGDSSSDRSMLVNGGAALTLTVISSLFAIRAWLGYSVPTRSWRMVPPTLWDKVFLPAFAAFNMFILDAEAGAVTAYVDTCRSLLHG